MTVLAPPFGPIPAAPERPRYGAIAWRPCACGVIHTLSTGSPAPDTASENCLGGLGGLVDNPLAPTGNAPDTQSCQANRIAGAHP